MVSRRLLWGAKRNRHFKSDGTVQKKLAEPSKRVSSQKDIETRFSEAISFLVAQGYSLHDLSDYEDGVTVTELFEHYQAAQKLVLERQRHEVQGMTVALASLFQPEVLQTYFSHIDDCLALLDPAIETSSETSPSAPAIDRSVQEVKVQQSMQQLAKLTAFLQEQ